MKSLRFLLLAGGCLGAFAAHAGGDAVSTTNIKIDMGGGTTQGNFIGSSSGSLTVPLGSRFGLQWDGGVAKSEQDDRFGSGLHLFTRDPQQYLLGVTANWAEIGGMNIYVGGLEAEYYYGAFTLLTQAGLANYRGRSTGMAALGLGYYFTDNLKFSSGISGFANQRSFGLGAEWQPGASPISLYVDGGVSPHDSGFIIGGVVFSFGSDSDTLKKRQRNDDPANNVKYMHVVPGGSLGGIAAKEKPGAVRGNTGGVGGATGGGAGVGA